MNIDSDKIIAGEYNWVYQNEPTFKVNGNTLTGKVGRTPNGESIILSIEIPEFYPVIRPNVKVLNNISHPNLDNGILSLQLLDEWETNYRVKDIIANARRLFIKSKKSIGQKANTVTQHKSTSTMNLESEILNLQKQINTVNKQITDTKNKKLQQAGLNNAETLQVSEKIILKSQLLAVEDLIELLGIKFEEADIDQTDFFRLYRKYIKDKYIAEQQLKTIEVDKNGTKTQTETKRSVKH